MAEARKLGWLGAVEKILNVMSTKISQRRQKYKQRHGNEIVQRVAQVVNKSWDDAASMDVFNLEDERNEFKVVDTCGVRSASSNETPGGAPLQSGQQSTRILRPGRHWCSCGGYGRSIDTRACMLVLTSENGLKATYSMSFRARLTITTRTVQCMGYSQETLYLLC